MIKLWKVCPWIWLTSKLKPFNLSIILPKLSKSSIKIWDLVSLLKGETNKKRMGPIMKMESRMKARKLSKRMEKMKRKRKEKKVFKLWEAVQEEMQMMSMITGVCWVKERISLRKQRRWTECCKKDTSHEGRQSWNQTRKSVKMDWKGKFKKKNEFTFLIKN